VYAGYIHDEVDEDSWYLDTGIAVQRFRGSALGERTLRRLTWSKQKYGDGSALGFEDKTIMYATFGSMVLASAIGVFAFLL
jgi:hypothetical protein